MKLYFANLLSLAANTGLLCSVALPLAFPVVAFLDGGCRDYQEWSIMAMCLSLLVGLLPMGVFMALSDLATRLELSVYATSR